MTDQNDAESPAVDDLPKADYSTYLRIQIGRDLMRDEVKPRSALLEEMFALQHREGGFGKRVLLKGAEVQIEMQRADVALVTIPVTVALKGDDLKEFLTTMGVTQ